MVGAYWNSICRMTDQTNWQVLIFDPNGKFIEQWMHIGRPSDPVHVSDSGFFICDGPSGFVARGKLVRTNLQPTTFWMGDVLPRFAVVI